MNFQQECLLRMQQNIAMSFRKSRPYLSWNVQVMQQPWYDKLFFFLLPFVYGSYFCMRWISMSTSYKVHGVVSSIWLWRTLFPFRWRISFTNCLNPFHFYDLSRHFHVVDQVIIMVWIWRVCIKDDNVLLWLAYVSHGRVTNRFLLLNKASDCVRGSEFKWGVFI